MLYVYEYCPTDGYGNEVLDEFSQSCRMRFATRAKAEGFARAMALRFPCFVISKVPRCSRRFSDVG